MSKLPISERVHNWVQSAAALWPILIALLGGAVYGNSDTVKRWVHGPDDVVPVEVDQHELNSKINAKFLEIEGNIEKLEAEYERMDERNRAKLQSQINANRKDIEWLKN